MIDKKIISSFGKEYTPILSPSNSEFIDLSEYVQNAYLDLNLPENFAFKRKAAPLAALCYLYPKTVVYIPPTNRNFFEKELKITIEKFLELVEQGIIQPVIGHPKYYEKSDELLPLLDKHPPSVWARFDSSAEKFNRKKFFDDAENILPLNGLASLQSSQMKWKKHFPNLQGRALRNQIELEWRNIFGNLCVVGHEELARDIANLKQPELISTFLQTANEVIIYPQIIGLGGIPQYDSFENSRLNLFKNFENSVEFKPTLISEDIYHLFRGVDINISEKIDLKEITNFHEQGLSEALWKSHLSLLHEIEKSSSPFKISDNASEYLKLVNELKASSAVFSKKNKQIQARVKFFSRGIATACGLTSALISFDKSWNALGWGVAAYQITDTVNKGLEPILNTLLLKNALKDYQFYFWELKKMKNAT